MKVLLSLSGNPSGEWYHGSPSSFTRFDTKAAALNRGSNPSGIYLTQDKRIAIDHAGTGYLYTVEPKVKNIFLYKKTPITKKLIAAYTDALVQYTNYKLPWIEDHLIPELLSSNRLKPGLPGEALTYTYMNAGYDALLFNDMMGQSLAVFDHTDVSILSKIKIGTV